MSTAAPGLMETLESRTFFSAAPGAVGDQPLRLIGTIDMNADGQDDFVYYNKQTGQIWAHIAVHVPGKTVVTGRQLIMTLTDRNLEPVSVSDFNGDASTPDILLFHKTQRLPYVAYVNNLVGQTPIAFQTKPVTAGWAIETSANMDGDADEADIIWRNYITGDVAIWFCSGNRITGGYTINNGPRDLNWRIEAADDFDGDYKPDLLWRNYKTGQHAVWFMNASFIKGIASIPPLYTADCAWELAGVGDYNGDLLDDLVFRNYQTGQNFIWTMNETVKLGQLPLPPVTV